MLRFSYALVKRTPEVLEIIEKYKDGFKKININSRYLAQSEAIALKEIAKKAGLNRIVSYKDNKGNIQSKPLHELISSHFGRHTFVTRMARIMPLDDVKYLTGHKDTQSLNKNYLHQTVGDRINILNKDFNEAEKVEKHTVAIFEKDVFSEQFAYHSFITIIDLMHSNNDVFHLDSTKQAIKTIKDISKLNSYSKDADISKVADLEQVIFELSYYFRDPLLYSIFKHKEHYFGLKVDVPSTEEVEAMFALEDIERPKKQIQADIEAWENRNK